MLIVCPSCTASYDIEPQSFGESGRPVRCARCQNLWTAAPPGPGHDLLERLPAAAAAEEFVTIEGIDISGLGAEIEAKRIAEEEEAEADGVLAALARQEQAAHPLSLSAEPDPAWVGASFAPRRRRRPTQRGRWLRPGLSAVLLILIAANAGVIAWRADIVRLLPQTASIYAALGLPVNLRGLAFENIRMSRAEQDGVGVLIVEGSIVNVTARPLEVPRLRLALRNEARHEIYAWTSQPGRSILGAGETISFRSRLASPPSEARDVQVRFHSARDVIAGLK